MRAQLIRWAVLAVVVPIAAAGVKKIAERVEDRRGPRSKIARGLRKASETVRPSKH
ncbi:hypothetical protein [Jannaschia sp. R86511]|uniref:hypothetical protein n=1 Tax=Jannaschia sp. R86511 TaxID=3093853 RepID=UPI0036D36AA9